MPATATRFVVTVLTALLLALQFPATGPSFASAHDAPVSGAEPPQRPAPAAAAAEAERDHITCGTPDSDGDANGLLRTRDRHRSAAGSTPDTPSRSLLRGSTAGTQPQVELSPFGDAHRVSRSSTAHTAAALQVFRC
ncbi:hypothetical protein [Streptomyces sp. NPDC006551]|uniref:hypothetical protein n=1 Tax=Streptomyces sp. NPDC006551 TaxID=3157178 RepID=UPI0033B39338